MGAGPELPVIMVIMGVHLAFLTPAASASAALLHGNEWSDARSVWKSAPLVILASLVVMTLVVIGVGSSVF